MKNIRFLSIIGFFLIIIVSCNDDVLTENPPHIIAADNLLVNNTGFQNALNGLYATVRYEMMGTLNNNQNELFRSVMIAGTDNIYANFRHNIGLVLDEWGVRNNPSVAYYRNVWNWLYSLINGCNTVINRAENPDIDWTLTQKNLVVAEAKAMRAWAYRHLTYLWGDVPLNTEESSGSNVKDWTRSPIADVWKLMEEDLLFAEANLPETSSNPGKIVKGVATHYLAELYLTMGKNLLAKQKAEGLISGGTYKLITERYGVARNNPGVPFMDMFKDGNSNKHEGNTEALWVFQFEYGVTGGAYGEMRRELNNRHWTINIGGKTPIAISLENGGRGEGRFAATKFALDLYENGDDRFSDFAFRKYWLINNPAQIPAGRALGDTIRLNWSSGESRNNNQMPHCRKWDWANPLNHLENETYNDLIYLRLAETYLLLAEAQFKLNEFDNAAETLNIIRRRSKASEISAGDVTIDFILDERSRELFTEEHRRYVLTRNQKWMSRTKQYNKMPGIQNIVARDTILPIPQHAIDANIVLEMSQNPDY
jgi:starch-binding outer membrane protein, SusD/RagB family